MDDAAKKLQKSDNLFKLSNSPFRHMGKGKLAQGQQYKRSPFKHFK
jgi:hypothetical protein